MANLGTIILTNTDYQKLSALAEITILPHKLYQMQNLGDDFYIRTGETGEGFLIQSMEKFYYKTSTDDIYIKPAYPNSDKEKKINICEYESY